MGSQSQISQGAALTPWSTWGDFNNIAFAVAYAINKMQTVTLVRIQACSNDGGVSSVGTVNVLPLVNQIDGNGNATPHETIFNVPYMRLQGGTNAIILDPKVGDIGIALFASRDISAVIATKAQASPGSLRQFDFSDALYLGGLLNGVPTSYVQFDGSGNIKAVAPSIQLSNGGSLSPLMTENFYNFWTSEILPFLQGLGYTGPNPPSNSVTSIVEAQ